MNLENQVVSLELAMELKENGFPQDGLWWWLDYMIDTGEEPIIDTFIERKSDIQKIGVEHGVICVALTVAELGEALPKDCYTRKQTSEENYDSTWVCYCERTPNRATIADTEANARAKMWLYLKKEGLL